MVSLFYSSIRLIVNGFNFIFNKEERRILSLIYSNKKQISSNILFKMSLSNCQYDYRWFFYNRIKYDGIINKYPPAFKDFVFDMYFLEYRNFIMINEKLCKYNFFMNLLDEKKDKFIFYPDQPIFTYSIMSLIKIKKFDDNQMIIYRHGDKPGLYFCVEKPFLKYFRNDSIVGALDKSLKLRIYPYFFYFLSEDQINMLTKEKIDISILILILTSFCKNFGFYNVLISHDDGIEIINPNTRDRFIYFSLKYQNGKFKNAKVEYPKDLIFRQIDRNEKVLLF